MGYQNWSTDVRVYLSPNHYGYVDNRKLLLLQLTQILKDHMER
jgi:hypothetical protein